MLVFAFDFQAAENHRHNEDVVKRQAFFNQKSGKVEHSGFCAAFVNDKETKNDCNGDIKDTGPKGFFQFGFFGMAVEDKQIQKQKDKDN